MTRDLLEHSLSAEASRSMLLLRIRMVFEDGLNSQSFHLIGQGQRWTARVG
jgi:hypothetical protein